MASEDPPMDAIQEQKLSVYTTVKECFLGLAKVMEKGFSPPVSIDELGIVITPMPSGQGLQRDRDIIESSLQHLHMRLSQQSNWKMVKIISKDRTEFFIILYCSDAFSFSQEKAVQYALAKRLVMRQLEYTKAEVEDTGGEDHVTRDYGVERAL